MTNNTISVGSLLIGEKLPVAVQTMWKTPLPKNISAIVSVLTGLKKCGCDLVRFAVPDTNSAILLGELAQQSPLPLVADIHFDYRLAIECIKGGVHKIRINPGNIGADWKLKEVITAAKDKNVPLRIGINSGSLPKKYNNIKAVDAMLLAAEDELSFLEKTNYLHVCFSLKSSDIDTTVQVNRLFRKKYSFPLHIGLTEAGPLIPGIVKSTFAIGKLLDEGIGDTVRISLTDTMEKEIIAAREIVSFSKRNLIHESINLISCPRCGRSTFDTHDFIKKVEKKLYQINKRITVAIMGCVVNGPGEAKHADLGISGIGNDVFLFKKGELAYKIEASDAEEVLLREIDGFESSTKTKTP